MRIGFDGKRYFRNRTGLGNYSRGIVHALAGNYPNDEFFLLHAENTLPKLDASNLHTLVYDGGAFARSFNLSAVLKASQIDLYHGLSNEIPAGLNRKKIASVVTIHDVIFKRFPGYYPWFDRQVYHLKTKYAVKHAGHIIATSAATANDLQLLYGVPAEKMTVVYQPVQPEFYFPLKEAAEIQENYFIYVSSFTQRKNHGTLIQAFARIQKMTDWNLVLAGVSGETLDEVKQFVAHEKLENRVKIYENADGKTLLNLMKNAGAFVYPSFFEGFGIPLAEAAACGVPVVASEIPVFTELAEDSALYFHPNKFEEIADAMLQITNPDTQARLREKLQIIRNKTDVHRIAAEIMAVYKGVR